MNSKLFLATIFICLFVSTSGNSQGLNNEYDIDQTDLVNAFEALGLEIYKFPVKSNEDNTYGNIVIEKYLDGELEKTENFYQKLKPLLKMLDEPLDQTITKLDNNEKWLRFYIHTKDTSFIIHSVNGNSKTKTDFSLKGFSITGSRGFGDLPKFYSKKRRVFTYYANRDPNLISCPGDATPKEIANLYDLAIIAYIEPITLTE